MSIFDIDTPSILCKHPHCQNVAFDMDYCHRLTCPKDYDKYL